MNYYAPGDTVTIHDRIFTITYVSDTQLTLREETGDMTLVATPDSCEITIARACIHQLRQARAANAMLDGSVFRV